MRILFVTIFVSLFSFCSAQRTYTMNGYLTEKGSGESLIGANIYVQSNTNIGTVSNNYGFYSITLIEGEYDFVFSYTGYKDVIKHVILNANLSNNISLGSGLLLDEVVITSEELKKNVQSTEMGTQIMNVETIKKLPSLFGEIDILKSLQLMPGVSSAT
ncbi:MAG: carboxypeptidase-like regulatory domain-containing protein, partial [Saprospiraceae bacterium]